ncbi:MAG: PQQ-binding-like beta-propeller repeat protein [Mucilaginibacter sp.]
MKYLSYILLLLLSFGASAQQKNTGKLNWPQAAGPDGSWQIHGPAVPNQWSVTCRQNILWHVALPNGGQSGIAVWGDRLFLTTFDVYKEGDPKFSGDIVGYCINAKTGKILWSVKLHGTTPSPMLYSYSDATSTSPVTDGKYVWFTDNSGEMGCWDYTGKEIWRRQYKPWGDPYPFNKQHEPFLFGDVIINVEPLDDTLPGKRGWNFLRGIDKLTGKTKWIADDGTTTYCTSVFGYTADGRPAILTGRGGHHGVPERPVGLSLIDLSPGHEGKTIWRFVASTDADGNPLKEPGSLAAPTWQVLYTLHWDKNYAYWFKFNPEESHLVIDSHNGKLLREQSLIKNVDYRQWDPAAKQYIIHKNVNLRDMRELSPRSPLAPDEVMRVLPAWHCNMVINGYHYFLTTVAHRRNEHPPKGRGGPSHCVARVNIATDKVEYLEVPVTVIRKPGKADSLVYGVAVRTSTLNSLGQDIAAEDRSKTDGWETPAFWGSPVAINDNIYFTTSLGITYVINSKAAVLDKSAIVAINDLGPSGETWSMNSISYSKGLIYHRTLKELICIGKK